MGRIGGPIIVSCRFLFGDDGKTYAATLYGLLGEGLGHGLEGDRAQHAGDLEYGLGYVVPVVVVLLQHGRAHGLAGDGGGFSRDGVALSAAKELAGSRSSSWRYLLENEEIVVLQQIVVAIPGLGRGGVADRSEFVKDTRRWLGSIVEEEHDPEINNRAMLGGQDNGGLLIGVVIHEVAQSIQHLGGLVGREDVVATPDLVDRVCLHGVCGDDAEVVTATLQ